MGSQDLYFLKFFTCTRWHLSFKFYNQMETARKSELSKTLEYRCEKTRILAFWRLVICLKAFSQANFFFLPTTSPVHISKIGIEQSLFGLWSAWQDHRSTVSERNVLHSAWKCLLIQVIDWHNFSFHFYM